MFFLRPNVKIIRYYAPYAVDFIGLIMLEFLYQ